MANSKDGKFQKDDPETKDAAKKGGESSRSGSERTSATKSSGKAQSKTSEAR